MDYILEKFKNNDMLSILIGGDVCPTYANLDKFEEGKARDILPEKYFKLIQNADFSIVNVECPLTKEFIPITKIGPALKASPLSVNLFKTLGVTAVCLANNHILDYGDKGLEDTLKVYYNAGIQTVGAGIRLKDARVPLIQRFPCGRSIGVVAMAENEFSIAGKDSPGANPIDFVNYTIIRDLKKNINKVLVILHAGTEMRCIPRPGLIDLCHFLIEEGADAVIVQHTHCVGGVEYYNNAPIVYGQGNFIFGKIYKNEIKPQIWWEGMLVEINWENANNNLSLQLHPFLQSPDHMGIRLLTEFEEEEFRKKQYYFSEIINNRDTIERSWQNYCSISRDTVLLNLMGASRIPRGLAYRGLPLIKIWLKMFEFNRVRNMISCESHRELVLDVLKSLQKPF